MLKFSKLAAAAAFAAMAAAAMAGEVEVLHYWTSGGEAKSLDELKTAMASRGYSWKDFAVTGGGGENAMNVLKKRVLADNPPAAAMIKGPTIQEWAQLNVLTNLDTMAQFSRWDEVLPKVIADQMKYQGHYVAVPVNVHRVNWLWANSAVLKKAGVTALPKTYQEFFAAADKVRAAGFIALAHGGQDWQDFTVFESVALGVGGTAFYNKALVGLDEAALTGSEMRKTLEVFRRLKPYTDDKSAGRDWNQATALVIAGKAGFQLMGDWAKGEFLAAHQEPGRDFSCTPAPGTAHAYSFNVDSFAMFQLKNGDARKAQGYLAFLLMGQNFQEQFSLRKGSIPARLNMNLDKFDECARLSGQDFSAMSRSGALVPSVAHGMAVSSAAQSALRAAVSDFWRNDQTTVNDTLARLALVAGARAK